MFSKLSFHRSLLPIRVFQVQNTSRRQTQRLVIEAKKKKKNRGGQNQSQTWANTSQNRKKKKGGGKKSYSNYSAPDYYPGISDYEFRSEFADRSPELYDPNFISGQFESNASSSFYRDLAEREDSEWVALEDAERWQSFIDCPEDW